MTTRFRTPWPAFSSSLRARRRLAGTARALLAPLALGLAVAVTAIRADAADDRYVAGYAAAILERQLQLPGRSVTVDNGVLTVDLSNLDGGRREAAVGALSAIPGVVEVRATPAAAAPPSGGMAVPSAGAERAPGAAATATPGEGHPIHLGILPGGQLFNPLIADPRWPHFSASYQRYLREGQLQDVGAVSFGETFALYRAALGPGFWELGMQAGVFAVFDMNAESKDLVNADYFAAAIAGYRLDRLSALARVSHTSSHLGDEFLLGNRIQRVNLSYESADLKLSYDIGPWLGESSELGAPVRLYAGGSYLFHREPASLKPWAAQAGVELRSPWTLGGTRIRPIAGADVQMREENGWDADLSVRAGLQFDGVLLSRNMQLLLEYFHGHSPNGQFYKQRIDYLGVGVHFHF